MPVKGFRERLRDGESIIIAEGYMWELERRGFIKNGVYTPEVVLEQPERVRNLHEEFVHAGSDVVEAFTYYGHREKLRAVGLQDDVEILNMAALKLARDVADKYGCLMAGDICNTTIYDPDNGPANDDIRMMFKEQIEWAVKGGADYLIGETFNDLGEAKLALEAMLKYGNGLPTVVTMAAYWPDVTTDDVPIPQALRQLEEMGADVVGLNCSRGPATMMPLIRKIKQVCKGPIAALPVPYRTSPSAITFKSLLDPVTGKRVYPLDVAPLQCTRSEIRAFAEEAREVGVQYIGLCCGNSSHCMRELAEVYGRTPPASKYAPELRHSMTVGDVDKMAPHVKKVQSYILGTAFGNELPPL